MVALRHAFELFNGAQILQEMIGTEQMLEQVDVPQLAAPRPPVTFFEGFLFAKGAGQHSIRKGAVGHHADIVFAAVREDFLLHPPVEHIPAVLHDIDAPRFHAFFDLVQLEVG